MSRRSAARPCCRGCSASCATCVIAAVLGAGALSDAYLRGPADPQPVPPPAGGRRAQRRLRADVAAHPRPRRRATARAGSAKTCSALMLARARRPRACSCIVFAPVRRALLAPGFAPAASASCSPSTSLRLPMPYHRDRRRGRGRGRDAQCRGPRRRRRLRHRVFNVRADRRGRGASLLVGRRRHASGRLVLAAPSSSPAWRSCCWSAARCSACRSRRAARGSAVARDDAPLLRARGAGPDRRRHPAAQADGRRDRGVVVAGGGVVALLRQPPLRAAARRRLDRDRAVMVPAIAASVRAPTTRRDRRPRSRAPSRSRSASRCRPRSRSRCWPRRSPAACSSAARSGRATPPQSRRRWRRSAPACPATRWKRCSARCRSRTRTRARRCWPRSPGWRPRSPARSLLFPRYGHVGVAAAIALSGWVGAALLGVVLARRGWLAVDRALAAAAADRRWRPSLMGVVVVGLQGTGCAHARRDRLGARSRSLATWRVAGRVPGLRGLSRRRCRLFGVARHRASCSTAPPSRLTAPLMPPLAPARRAMACDAAQSEGRRNGIQGTGVFRRAADRQPASRQLSRRDREVRRAAGELRLHLLRRRPARHHGVAGPDRAAAARSAR